METVVWSAVRRAVLCVAVVGSLVVQMASVGAQAPQAPQAMQAPLTVRGATVVGRTSRAQPITLSVGLEPQNAAALEAFLQDLYTPGTPEYRQYLTPAQFTNRFFDAKSRAQVTKYLRGKGLTVNDPGIGSLLPVTGDAAQVEQAFSVTLTDYRDATGRLFHANDRTPAIDAAVAPLITGVTGLSTQSRPQPRFVRDPQPDGARAVAPRGAVGCAGAVAVSGAYTPNQFATAYDFTPLYTAGYKGEGQTIALVEYDDYVGGNVATYQSCFGSNIAVQRVPVNGGITSVGTGQSEVELDIEVIAGLAPHLAHLLVFEDGGSSFAGTFQAIANDNRANVVSTSWGTCEGDSTEGPAQRAAEGAVLKQLAAQGASVFNAYGDYGANGCIPITGGTQIAADQLGSSPYITDVGGTTLLLNANDTISSEVVWNNDTVAKGSVAVAGGGGISQYYARPSYQTGPGTTNSYSNGHREGPDITADGDYRTGYDVYTGDSGSAGTWGSIGGTSAGAPLYAAAFALINQKLAAGGKAAVGFANPTLYDLWRNHPAFVHDITSGDNCVNPSCGTPDSGTATYPATYGFDMASGIGSLDIAALSNLNLTPPPLALPATAPRATGPGVAYTTSLAATGGSGVAYTYALAAGSSLPAGLTLDTATGTISGTSPSAVGNYTFTLTVTDDRGATVSHSYTIVVAVPNATPAPAAMRVVGGTAGTVPTPRPTAPAAGAGAPTPMAAPGRR